jgi:hypothetical protein
MSERWIGIRLSATLAILGGLVTLLFAAILAWAAFFAPPPPGTAIPVKPLMLAMAVFFLAVSAWGLATGAGIFRRRGWARLSAIVFAVLLVGMGVSALLAMLFISMPPTPNLPPRTVWGIRAAISAFYAGLAVIGAWWLLLFNSAQAKRYFSGQAAPAPGSRPLSITIIGGYLLFTALVTALGAVLRLPAFCFGAVATGWAAAAVYTLYTAAEIWLGSGLLQMQRAARAGAIVYFVLVAASTAVSVWTPGFSGRMMKVEEQFPVWSLPREPEALERLRPLTSMGLVMAAVPIWFLVRRKEEFR